MAVQRLKWSAIALALLLCVWPSLHGAAAASPYDGYTHRLYVSAGSDALDPDGSSWTEAYTDLRKALRHAESLLAAAPEDGASVAILVAEGIYAPGKAGERRASFRLNGNVALYGGFCKTDPRREQRDPLKWPTTLTGDLDESGSFTSKDAYHVVSIIAPSTTAERGPVLDGFHITGGNADGVDAAGGDPEHSDSGGGILIVGGRPSIRNCTVFGNTASSFSGGGGGLFLLDSSATFAWCRFFDNSAVSVTGGGGAAFIKNGAPVFSSSIFVRNTAVSLSMGGGGAIFNYGGAPSLAGTLLCRNIARTGDFSGKGGGGALFNLSGNAELRFSTLLANSAPNGEGATIYDAGRDAERRVTITGSILSATAGEKREPQIFWKTTAPKVSSSLLPAESPAVLREQPGNRFGNPGFVNARSCDIRLQAASPARNGAVRADLPEDAADTDNDTDREEILPVDLAGRPRIEGGAPDMGAVEYQPASVDIGTTADFLSRALELPEPKGERSGLRIGVAGLTNALVATVSGDTGTALPENAGYGISGDMGVGSADATSGDRLVLVEGSGNAGNRQSDAGGCATASFRFSSLLFFLPVLLLYALHLLRRKRSPGAYR